MKPITGFSAAALILFATSPDAFAIEGLKISLNCPDVILSWPSIEGDIYIVQHCQTLDSNASWLTLADGLPAATGTNLTLFVHTNRVQCSSGAPGGTNDPPDPPPAPGSAMMGSTGSSSAAPLAMRPGIPSSVAPVYLYPPGFDLSGFLIFEPATGEWKDAAGYTTPLRASGLLSAGTSQGTDGPEPDDPDPEPLTGFYRVVRVGINLFGITNGTVFSGQVPLPLEFGNPDTNRVLAAVFLTDTNDDGTISGSTFPSLPYDATNHLTGTWDTTHVTNGTYAIQVGARLTDGTVYLDYPVTVIVSNTMWFPDPWDVGGTGIYVGVQTLFTSGAWHLDVYDDHNIRVGFLNGTIAADGYCNYPGVPGPGFTLDNRDQFGNQNPSTAYTLVMRAGATPPYQYATNKVFIEPPWDFATKAVVCHMNFFEPTETGWTEVRELMNTIWSTEGAFHPNLLGELYAPFEISSPYHWYAVMTNLVNPAARDFFYFGDGSESAIGPNTNVALRVSDIQALLQNHYDDPLTATNRHPYRFVFFDGCNTADAGWPQAFGIPKQEGMLATDFGEKRGIRPRAFMGWNRKKVISTGIIGGAVMFPPHLDYMRTFWEKWAERAQSGGPVRDIQAAIDAAKLAAPNASLGMKLYGAKDLIIDY